MFHYDLKQPIGASNAIVWAAAIVCLWRPANPLVLAGLLTASTVVFARDLPAAANHIVLAVAVNITVLVALLISCMRHSTPSHYNSKAHGTEMVDKPVAVALSIVYFFGAFHKLNSGFVDTTFSCAGVLLSQALSLQGLTVNDLPRLLVAVAAWLTLIIEAGLALCLVVPSLRLFGVILGLGFHLVLSLAHFIDFATFVFALYLLVVPLKAFDRTPSRIQARITRIAFLCYIVVTLLAWSAVPQGRAVSFPWYPLQWFAWATAVFGVVAPSIREALQGNGPSAQRGSRPRVHLAFLVFPLVVALNGITPYVGFKTVANYTMFSNLRVEGGATNHYLPVRSLLMTDDVEDLVDVWVFEPAFGQRVRKTDSFWLRKQFRWLTENRPVRVPFLELQRAVLAFKTTGLQHIHVRYVHKGVSRNVDDAGSDHALSPSLDWVTRYLRAFRAVPREGEPAVCRW